MPALNVPAVLLVSALLAGGSARASDLVFENGREIKSSLGYSVRWPEGYTGLRDERDNGSDTVVAYPEGRNVPFSDMGDLGKIKALRMVVLNAYPQPKVKKSLKEFEADIERALVGAGRVYSARPARCGLGPAVLIRIAGEPGYVSVLAAGENALYEFIAGELHPPLKAMLGSLREAAPDHARESKRRAVQELAENLDGLQRRDREASTGLKVRPPRRSRAGFTGRYGTFFRCGPQWEVTSDFSSRDPLVEIIRFFKKGTGPEAFKAVERYGEYGVVVVEVLPRPRAGMDVLAQARRDFPRYYLAEQKVGFRQGDVTAPFPGVAYSIYTPYSLDYVFLQSGALLYKFISGAKHETLWGLIGGLREEGGP